MKIKTLRVQQFRNHDDVSYVFSPSTTLIYGENGAGKTSLLEAIYVAFRGSSFKGVDRDIVNERRDWYRVDIEDDLYKRTVLFDNRAGKKLKQFVVDGKKTARLSKKDKRPIILFSPDDLRLISGSPSRRRQYIDRMIAQYDESYALATRRYERALLQRNKLLKSPGVTTDALFSWNVILSENGSKIISLRRQVIEYLNDVLPKYYANIAAQEALVSIEYDHAAHTPQELLHAYEKSFERDRAVGSTHIGPHRHDFTVFLRDKHAADIASRGENRTLILAMKYAEADILRERYEELPLILLDDVFGELDKLHRESLIRTFTEYQVIITATDKVKLASDTSTIAL
jgi:DNA replication and repair protein RecF